MKIFSKIIKSLLIFIWIAFFAIGIIINHKLYRIAECIVLIFVAVLPLMIYLIIKAVTFYNKNNVSGVTGMRTLKNISGILLCITSFSLLIAFISTLSTEKNDPSMLIGVGILDFLAILLFRKTKKEKETIKHAKDFDTQQSISPKNTAIGDYIAVTTEYVPSEIPKDIAKDMRKSYTLMQAQRDAEIMSESFKLAGSTTNLDVFCMRYNLAMQKAHTLLQAEQAGVRNIKKLSCHKACLTVINASHALKLVFLENYEQKNFEQAENLKTDKGKLNRYRKMKQALIDAEPTFADLEEYENLIVKVDAHILTLGGGYSE